MEATRRISGAYVSIDGCATTGDVFVWVGGDHSRAWSARYPVER